MSGLYGRDWAEVRRRIGILAQVARVDSFTEDNGPARGARRLRLVNGGGLEVEVHPDRALDLGQMTIDGIPLAWMSPTGITAPAFYEPHGTGWLRTFGGGLLATCGLDTYGPPSTDAGQELGQHGRIGAVPATVTKAVVEDGHIRVEGTVRQASTLGENLVLRRTISSQLGSTSLRVSDVVTNEGMSDSPHMILYHANLGWPLLDETAELVIPSASVTPRDAVARAGADSWAEISAPVPGFQEQVFQHDFAPQQSVSATLTNARLGVSLALRFDGARLPSLYEWKMLGEGHYVLGLEPTNVGFIFGRARAREAGLLPVLAPGESAAYAIDFVVERLPATEGAARE